LTATKPSISQNQRKFFITVLCPKCHSKRIGILNRARKAGGAIGTLAGATSGAAGALQGARAGWNTALIIAPRHPYSRIAAAIIGGLFGGAAGCAIGASFGEVVDENILDNYYCLSCGHKFSCRGVEKAAMNVNHPGFDHGSMAHPDDQP
jgi:hypothetical protein